MDYTYKRMKEEGIGVAWVQLARFVAREMSHHIGDVLGFDVSETIGLTKRFREGRRSLPT